MARNSGQRLQAGGRLVVVEPCDLVARNFLRFGRARRGVEAIRDALLVRQEVLGGHQIGFAALARGDRKDRRDDERKREQLPSIRPSLCVPRSPRSRVAADITSPLYPRAVYDPHVTPD